MSRRGDDAEAEALQVVVRARGRASARARSRCTSPRRRGGARGCRRAPGPGGRSRGGAGAGLGAASASAVGAGVAELEALVDEGEVGQQVADGRVRDRRPVRVRAGAEAEALDRAAVALDDAARGAARALDAADAELALLAAALGGGRPDRAVEQRRPAARTTAGARARAARDGPGRRPRRARGDGGLEAVVGEPRARSRARRARARRRGQPGRSRRGARRRPAERTPISGSRSWNDELNWSSRQPRSASSRSVSSSACDRAHVLEARARCRRRGRCRRGSGGR